jgi:hypothetical protein
MVSLSIEQRRALGIGGQHGLDRRGVPLGASCAI